MRDNKVSAKPTKLPAVNRRIVEFCAGENSRMGRHAAKTSSKCEVIRLTAKEDVTSKEGFSKAAHAVQADNVLLWASMPCTGGSPWQQINRHKPGGEERLQQHIRDFKAIWKSFVPIALECNKHGGKVAIEWPTGCSYWKLPEVKGFMSYLCLKQAQCHGCALGLTDKDGKPIKKPWTIATNDANLHKSLNKMQCPGKLAHPEHTRLEGKLTKLSEEYTDDMVKIIHRAWKQSTACRVHNNLEHLDHACPAMPTVVNGAPQKHREKHGHKSDPFLSCVAKLLNKREVNSNPEAQKVIRDEFRRLADKGTWLNASVKEWDLVATEARKTGVKVHVGRVFGIASLKGSELKPGDPDRKLKGRFVFQGNNVKDENYNPALFEELSSSPATLQAMKCVDAYGSFPGNVIEQCDAEQAYIQAKLEGTPTWVRLPRDQWPPEWKGKYKDPVVRLNLALYGHPDSGGHWEKHCAAALRKAGFEALSPWRSTFWHPKLKLMLVVYVDDFKMAGPKGNLSMGWQLIRKHITTDEPKPAGKCLGCQHDISRVNKGGAKLTTVEYNMEDFLVQCVEAYLNLAKLSRNDLKTVHTPFLDEDRLDDKDDHTGSGALADIAARVLMKVLYCARLARFDLLKAISNLATKITKWTRNCDKRLHQLVSYINSSLGLRLTGVIGDTIDNVSLELYSDADFAGDKSDSKSTSGVFLAVKGPNTFFPLSACSKKQSCVSHSTPEAELVAANLAVRTEGLPALDLWTKVSGKPIILTPITFSME